MTPLTRTNTQIHSPRKNPFFLGSGKYEYFGVKTSSACFSGFVCVCVCVYLCVSLDRPIICHVSQVLTLQMRLEINYTAMDTFL